MKQIKANSTGVVLGVIFIILVIAGIVVALILAVQKTDIFEKKETNDKVIKFYLKNIDLNSKEDINGNYILNLESQIQGELFNGFNEISFKNPNKPFDIYCSSNGYYSQKYTKNLTTTEMNENISKFECNLKKIGNLNIKHSGNLNKELNKIVLNVTSDSYFLRPSICFSWTTGIIKTELTDIGIVCELGMWTNKTKENLEEEYENNLYRCGNYYFETCESIKGNKCIPFEITIPYRFIGKYDSCYYLGNAITSTKVNQIPIEVKTLEFKNRLDELKITFFDNDLVYDGEFKYLNELNRENIAGDDIDYVIKYQ